LPNPTILANTGNRVNRKGDRILQAQQVLQERYQLQRQLGRTAAGRQTWLAKDLQSNEQVTLKLLAFAPQMQWEEWITKDKHFQCFGRFLAKRWKSLKCKPLLITYLP
jgi:hypothetical protein